MSVVYSTGGSVVLELETVDGTPPAVRVTVSGVASMTTFSLQRLCEGKTVTVPGWRAKQFTDSYVDLDWAAPINRPVTYTLLVGGVVVASATITLTSTYAWLQDPLQPDKALPIAVSGNTPGVGTLDAKSLKSFDYDSVGRSVIPILGSSYPLVFGGQRLEASHIVYRFRTFTDADAATFLSMIQGAPILLLRPLTGMVGLPAVAYLDANVLREPFTTHLPGGHQQYWTITGDIVAAVLRAAVTGSVTYDQAQQLLAGYTYAQIQAKAAATTYLDWQKNPLIFSTL